MSINLKTSSLFECKTPYLNDLFEQSTYPWDMLPKIKEYIDTFKSLNPNIGDKEIEVRVNEFYKIGFAASSDSDVMEISRTEKF